MLLLYLGRVLQQQQVRGRGPRGQSCLMSRVSRCTWTRRFVASSCRSIFRAHLWVFQSPCMMLFRIFSLLNYPAEEGN